MIRSVAIFGGGTMGGGIALSCAKVGLRTTVIDTTDGALDLLRVRIHDHLTREMAKGRLGANQADDAVEHLVLSRDPHLVSGADLVIEAVHEDLEVKRGLMRRIESLLKPQAIIATNTSCLLVRDIAAALDDPGRMLGLHYFSPAEISPIVELISTEATRPDLSEPVLAFLAATGKSPLPCKDSPGFALNRFFCPYCNEAVRLLDDGVATMGQIDAVACEALGVAAGPFRVMNLTKPVIMLKAMESLAVLGPFYRPADGLRALGAALADWQIDEQPATTSETVKRTIADRLTGALLLSAADAMAAGVVAPADLDRGARAALRFARTPVSLLADLPVAESTRLMALVDVHKRRGNLVPMSPA
ncbi:hypothetical protein F8A10_00570 [Paracoccus kondratievae]|uniref:3-hydroxyacyl-CoA dehydrogenase family protein n=1 Tax=Paracoccus kondratievae TaxID=135740 RepID=UPI0012662A2C|nr:3-hydroxyacyl-CoA dehydrogenase family protein [Paracoccus kondratievae]QFQ86039.1 hypothetical protein F8A10_00570 [Paracoccus kondratievae]